MLAVIEGLDRTGKTLLAKALQLQTAGTIIHAGKPTHHPLEEYETVLQDYNPRAPRTVILDRWHVGERVWPFVFKRATEYDAAMHRHVMMVMRSRGAILIYAYRFKMELLRALADHDEPLQGAADVEQALGLYEQELTDEICPLYRYRHGSYIGPMLRLMSDTTREVAGLHDISPHWIGQPRPAVLLVGENVNDNDYGWTLPFVPYRGTSGHFLFDELGHSGWWKNTAIVNAFRPDGGTEHLHSLWLAFGRPKVIGLGKAAQAELRKQRVPHATATHPQYVRRFERKQGPGYYLKMLEEAVK